VTVKQFLSSLGPPVPELPVTDVERAQQYYIHHSSLIARLARNFSSLHFWLIRPSGISDLNREKLAHDPPSRLAANSLSTAG
jgi:hypothetical protein